jgi:uncharacterized membrane protein YphA (DoxX/SURF4 family)
MLADLPTTDAVGIAEWFLAFVFLWSGGSKLVRPAPAAAAIVNFGIGRRPRRLLAVGLGSLELVLGLVLALQLWRVEAPIVAGAISLVFAGFIARSLARGERFPCACFGDPAAEISAAALARAVALTALALALAGLATRAGHRPDVLRATEEATAALGLLGCVVTGSLIVRVARLRPLVRPTSELGL